MQDLSTGSLLLSLALIIGLSILCGMYGLRGLWKFLRNLKFAIALIAAICLFTLLGSLLIQDRPPSSYMQTYGPEWGGLIVFFGFDDVFHTFWFNGILLVLCCSILSCASQRFRFTLNNLGFLITHTGLLLIGVGAFVTGVFGLSGRMILNEGGCSSVFYQPEGDRMNPSSLPFSLMCERFWLDHYDSGNGALIVFRPDGQYEQHVTADPGTRVFSMVYDATVTVLDVFPDYHPDGNNPAATRSEKWRNPAIRVQVERNGISGETVLSYLDPNPHGNAQTRDILMQYSREPQFLHVKSYNSRINLIEDGKVVGG
ncbi:MAG TPA: cytochrome c biogenesis protein ResB, partial [bacterium]|nr:cytochrome c biogenesis protein ResB [bacterium]